jgi:Tfp pilus assembly protein PilF
MRALMLSSIALALAGCASAPVAEVPRQLFADALFPAWYKPLPEDLFAVSDDMRHFAATRVKGPYLNIGPQDGLAEALRRELRVEYDATSTTPAALTFASRSGNCLSLVILTAAFAKHLDIPFTYQSVHGVDNWSRAAGIAFRSGHVNVRLGSPRDAGRVVDLMTAVSAPKVFMQPIPETTIVAMYSNNRAAESLVDGQLETAYWWARAAVEAAPDYVSALNTLGVVYERHDNLREAEAVLRFALAREPENVHVLTNLANVVERNGRLADARVLRDRLALIDPHPPFHFLDLGLAALDRGDSRSALTLLNQELRRMPYNEEVHFALARAEAREGDVAQARRHLALAAEYSTTRDRRNIYGAKLAHLKAAGAK